MFDSLLPTTSLAIARIFGGIPQSFFKKLDPYEEGETEQLDARLQQLNLRWSDEGASRFLKAETEDANLSPPTIKADRDMDIKPRVKGEPDVETDARGKSSDTLGRYHCSIRDIQSLLSCSLPSQSISVPSARRRPKNRRLEAGE